AHGLKAPLGCLSQARFGIAWGALGAASACLGEAIAYSRQRILFGRPLAATQSAQIKLAEMARALAGAQLIALQLGRLKQAGTLQPQQISLAKWNNCRVALDIARGCRDLLGAAGITTEHAALRHALNLESVITYEGTETVHQLVIGRELTGFNAF
ncbi:acyl-CoA dehydrogenase, partial [Xanthomonas sp. Kuri4-1]